MTQLVVAATEHIIDRGCCDRLKPTHPENCICDYSKIIPASDVKVHCTKPVQVWMVMSSHCKRFIGLLVYSPEQRPWTCCLRLRLTSSISFGLTSSAAGALAAIITLRLLLLDSTPEARGRDQ